MANNIIKLEKISKHFSGVQALNNINFEIGESQIYCLAGENGCGKSTMIKIISGFYQPDCGNVFLNGKLYQHLHPIQAMNEGIQVIYQDFSLFSNLTVAENIGMNTSIKNKKKIINYKDYKAIAREGLGKIQVDMDVNQTVENLSVADKQLVAIARALASENSKLIIMDEPTTALTHHEIENLLKIILRLKEHGISILFVSHKLRELTEVCDIITIMRNGHIVNHGPISEFDEKKISSDMLGKEIDPVKHLSPMDKDTTVLEVNGISYKHQFNDISFKLHKGEILGITGLLGCGRREVALSLFGVLPAKKGLIKKNNEEIHVNSILTAVKKGIGYVPEDRLTEGLFLSQNIFNNTIVSSLKKFINSFGLINFPHARSTISDIVKEVKLNTDDLSMQAMNLSGGNQQKVVIAKWLCADTDILILNGPTVGVDIGSKFEIHKKLKEIASQGKSIIIISDDITELLETCNNILLIHKGQVAANLENSDNTEKELITAFENLK
ncbi:MAG: hypothetical protein B0D92_03285 [Spirochaeta sp. LUC14_002_19_P3]|nr:MAG: hypothetical protein B0D92_03285 [Spirochaeta sp. LUC14_002_19_P3]